MGGLLLQLILPTVTIIGRDEQYWHRLPPNPWTTVSHISRAMKSGEIRIKHAGERKRVPAVSRGGIEFSVIGRLLNIDMFNVLYCFTGIDNNFTDCSTLLIQFYFCSYTNKRLH